MGEKGDEDKVHNVGNEHDNFICECEIEDGSCEYNEGVTYNRNYEQCDNAQTNQKKA
jgi:hypothetical protein